MYLQTSQLALRLESKDIEIAYNKLEELLDIQKDIY